MTTPPSAKPDTAISPYLSLRQAVRPAAFAYSILSREQKQAEALVAEANSLLRATQELLEAAGLYHLLTPEPGQVMPASDDCEGGQTRLLAAYSSAGMMWARIVGGCLALAEALAAESRWDDARRAWSYLEDVGEANAAKDLLNQSNKALLAKHGINNIHDKMTSSEIEDAISALEGVLREAPENFLVLDNIRPSLKCLGNSLEKYGETVQGRASNYEGLHHLQQLDFDYALTLANVTSPGGYISLKLVRQCLEIYSHNFRYLQENEQRRAR